MSGIKFVLRNRMFVSMDFIEKEIQNLPYKEEYSAFDTEELAGLFIPLLNKPKGLRQAAGIALRLEEPPVPMQDQVYIDCVDANSETLYRFGPFPEEEVVAIWRLFQRWSGLPLLSETLDGQFLAIEDRFGGTLPEYRRARRAYAFLSVRRPRFLTRRKMGRWSLRPVIRREREILRGGKG
jgi:hypothetical protein